ncbi:MAG: leucine-rich repeat domain-containing protein [Clostridia bacterium]|nr:leucine-rich repeat domain-containing protein [Clostridia bacterium]
MKKICTVILLVSLLMLPLTTFAASSWDCTGCGRRIPAILGDYCPYCGTHNHVWSPATCTEPETCSCGETRGSALDHQWDSGDGIWEATCTKTGLREYTCTVCGVTREETIPINPSNHKGETETRSAKAATCTEDGYTGDTYCLDCGALMASGRSIKATGHRWDSGDGIREATCAETGLKEYTCTVCGVTQEKTIPINPSNHKGGTELRNARTASCTENGYTGDTVCKDCGAVLTAGRIIRAAGHSWISPTCTEPKICKTCGATEGNPLGHSWDEGKVIRSATCAAEGVKRYTCTVCHETRSETLPINPSSHTGGTETRNKVENTCTEDGFSGDTFCKGCGALLNQGITLSAKGHHWVTATITDPKTCDRCGLTEGEPAGHFVINSNGEVTLTKFDMQLGQYEIEVPADWRSRPVTAIGDSAFEKCYMISAVKLPDSIKTIGEKAFSGCTHLTDINIPLNVTAIGAHAFEDCGITSISIPDGITVIAPDTFKSSDLTSIVLPDSIVSIGDRAFQYCFDLETIRFPRQLETIGDKAFYSCQKLTDLTFYNNLTSIGKEAFEKCRALTSLSLPSGLTTIGDEAFFDCISLAKITLPSSINMIGRSAFYNCESLESVSLPRVTAIEAAVFHDCHKLNYVYIPDSVTSIGAGAFARCFVLPTLSIPNSVASIGKSAFQACNNLTVTVGKGSFAEDYCINNQVRYKTR